jgi:iron-sulfur cluster assembly accessory protein
MITITDGAIEHLRGKLAEMNVESNASAGLRLLVEKGGCAGMQYGMKFGEHQDGDAVFERDGVRVLVDRASLVFLDGVELDYSDALTDAGFKIRNPNAARSCGCGTSFEPAVEGQVPAYDPEEMDGAVCGGDASSDADQKDS